MKALILNNKVVDLSTTPFEVHESMFWVDCDNTIEVGFTYNGSDFISNVPVLSPEEKLEELRAKRTELLSSTDWWVLSDQSPTQEQLDYRQALRDITNTYTSLDDVIWPQKP